MATGVSDDDIRFVPGGHFNCDPVIGGDNIGPGTPIPPGFKAARFHGPSGIVTITPLMASDLTMRDAFAAEALPFARAEFIAHYYDREEVRGTRGAVFDADMVPVAKRAYLWADAMLAARSA